VKNLSVCYIGDNGIHRRNTELLFRNGNIPICFFGSWRSSFDYEAKVVSFRASLAWYRGQLTGIASREYKRSLYSFLVKNHVSCVMAYWGTNVFADIITIRKLLPNIRIVLNVLCHPMGQTSARIRLQNIFFRISIRRIDGLIYSSNTMKIYFEKNIMRGRPKPSLIMPPYWSRDLCCNKLLFNDRRPNIFFPGRMDWWNGDASDNMEKIIGEIANSGVHVYYSNKDSRSRNSEYRHPFHPVPLEEMKELGGRFDAGLIAYNLQQCKDDTRFRVTIPDRLMAAIAMGLPIAIPKNGYDACKELLANWPGILQFDTISDLSNQLSDVEHINELKRACIKKCSEFHAENHFESLVSFLAKSD
jgi:hypothetical protein